MVTDVVDCRNPMRSDPQRSLPSSLGDVTNEGALAEADLFGFDELSFEVRGERKKERLDMGPRGGIHPKSTGSCLLRVGIPQVGGRLVQAAREGGLPSAVLGQ